MEVIAVMVAVLTEGARVMEVVVTVVEKAGMERAAVEMAGMEMVVVEMAVVVARVGEH